MPSCLFKHCKNSSQTQKKEDGISFHRFPTDIDLYAEWLSIVRKSRKDNSWRPSKFCVVCSSHFRDEDVYFTDKGRRLLKRKSKPTQNLGVPPQSLEIPSDASGSSKCPVENATVEEDNAALNSSGVNQKPETCDEENLDDTELNESDLQSIFDDPQTSNLRRQLRKHQYLKLVTRRKVKALQETVRRLRKRNIFLKKTLKDLKLKTCAHCGRYPNL
ncbi:unnamed protein product [Chilo suppressalis]|uniref:THAP-type domain-containing protein n=1 Tax=Chilo suppressalis TaxID=168631 RepID=A0ABN8AX81_CHISP|nr:unnamed protein product [Chilo suppressalis]